MCLVHVNQVCDGEVPECYDGWEALLLAETERKQAWITRQNEMENFSEPEKGIIETHYPEFFWYNLL